MAEIFRTGTSNNGEIVWKKNPWSEPRMKLEENNRRANS